jgi:DNA-binding GntR family transcriptional regulator
VWTGLGQNLWSVPVLVSSLSIGSRESGGRQYRRPLSLFRTQPYGLCGNACLIETIDLLAQKVYGIRSYANAFPESLDRARRDHLDMIKALRGSRRDDLVVLTRRHLKPSPEAYIKAYERRFGKADLASAH